MGDIATAAGIEFYPLGSVTDTKLLGGVEYLEIYDPETERNSKQKVENPGLLSPDHDPRVNLLAMNECDILFDSKKTDYAKDLMTWFQKAMNPYGTYDNVLSKGTGSMDASFNSDQSFAFVSKLPQNFYRTITSTGFLQRTIVAYLTKSLKDKKGDNYEFLAGVGEEAEDLSDEAEIVGAVLNCINEFAASIEEFSWTDDAKTFLRENVFEMIHDPMDGMNSHVLPTIMEFSSRYQEMVVRLAHIHALTRLSDEVSAQDVGMASQFVKSMWRNVIWFIEDGLQRSKSERLDWLARISKMVTAFKKIQLAFKKAGKKQPVYIPREKIIITLMKPKYWGVTRDTAEGRLADAEEEGVFIRKRTRKGRPVIKIGLVPDMSEFRKKS